VPSITRVAVLRDVTNPAGALMDLEMPVVDRWEPLRLADIAEPTRLTAT
jgi:hypothetical protein